MTQEEWTAFAEDLALVIYKCRGIVYELDDDSGALQLLIQPRRRVDITRIRWPYHRKRAHDAPTLS